jgi:hypothetical protein
MYGDSRKVINFTASPHLQQAINLYCTVTKLQFCTFLQAPIVLNANSRDINSLAVSLSPHEAIQCSEAALKVFWKYFAHCSSILRKRAYTEISPTSPPTPKQKTKLLGLSPRANYKDQATAACLAKLWPAFGDRGCHVVSVTDPYGHILGFLDRSRYF